MDPEAPSLPPSPTATPTAPDANVDRSAQMRIGHPQIQEGDDYLIELFRKYVAGAGGGLSVFNVAAGSGYFTKQLADSFPPIGLVAHEDHPAAVEELRAIRMRIDEIDRRLADKRTTDYR